MYYGIDSDTATFPTGATSKDFYAGRRGTGTAANTTYWNATGAALAGKKYMYWGIKGPSLDPNFSASNVTADKAYAWGQAQGAAARTAWLALSGLMKTIFGDVETGFGGWFSATQTVNANLDTGAAINYLVFKGFCDKLASTNVTGVFTSPSNWTSIMGSGYSPSYAAVLWGSNWPGIAFNSPPSNFNQCQSINGITPTIWQYYGEPGTHDASKTGDANIATSLPS